MQALKINKGEEKVYYMFEVSLTMISYILESCQKEIIDTKYISFGLFLFTLPVTYISLGIPISNRFRINIVADWIPLRLNGIETFSNYCSSGNVRCS